MGRTKPLSPSDPPQPAEGPVRVLEEVLEPVADTMGFELIELQWAEGRGRVLRVFLDHSEGVSIDDCARMSRIFSNALDAAESAPQADSLRGLLSAPYTLEVSSPGIERPLRRLSHFQRFVGQRAQVRTHQPVAGSQRNFHGTIEAIEPDPGRPDDDRSGTVVLRATEGAELHRISLGQIHRAHLVYEG